MNKKQISTNDAAFRVLSLSRGLPHACLGIECVERAAQEIVFVLTPRICMVKNVGVISLLAWICFLCFPVSVFGFVALPCSVARRMCVSPGKGALGGSAVEEECGEEAGPDAPEAKRPAVGTGSSSASVSAAPGHLSPSTPRFNRSKSGFRDLPEMDGTPLRGRAQGSDKKQPARGGRNYVRQEISVMDVLLGRDEMQLQRHLLPAGTHAPHSPEPLGGREGGGFTP